MPVFAVEPAFVYPESKRFPFDVITSDIVKALECRSWCVAGIDVTFKVYGSGESKYRCVSTVRGSDFVIHFGRGRGVEAAACKLVIPFRSLQVFEDESGPTYHVYVGDDWESDKSHFMDSIKVNSKLLGERRTYLCYSGVTYRTRSSILQHDNDMGREYSPIGDEVFEYNTAEVFNEYSDWLRVNVLDYINTFPECEVAPMAQEVLTPYNGPVLYTLCTAEQSARITQGKNDASLLSPGERCVTLGNYNRLVNLGILDDGTLSGIARKGLIWCVDCGEELSEDVCRKVGLLSHSLCTLVRLVPKYSNHIYVADQSCYEDVLEDAWIKLRLENSFCREPGAVLRTRLTDGELNDAVRARGRTLIPITEYRGTFGFPIYFIDRELDFNEVEIVSTNKKEVCV